MVTSTPANSLGDINSTIPGIFHGLLRIFKNIYKDVKLPGINKSSESSAEIR